MEQITLKKVVPLNELKKMLRKVVFRGLYDENGKPLKPYQKVKFSLAKVNPPKYICASPKIAINGQTRTLFSPQPTIYQNQLEIVRTVDIFLRKNGFRISELDHAIEYLWKGRGSFHILPPVVEKHTYDFKNGFFDLGKLSKRFKGKFVKDARSNLHELSKRYLNNFYLDEVSKISHLDIFNSNAPLINYGLPYSGKQDFYIICDGSHRADYCVEGLRKPVTVLLVEADDGNSLVPYYAFPVPFRPTIRLSSKLAEKMHLKLERDKIHLFNDFISKVLHYDWTPGGLNVSKLRSNKEIY